MSAAKEGIGIWYSGERKTRLVPVATFKRDCVKWWEIKYIAPEAIPSWFIPGACFQLAGRAANIVNAVIKDDFNFTRNYATTHVRDCELAVRQIRNGFASCLVIERDILVIVALIDVVGYGYRVQSRWERLTNDKETVIDELSEIYDEPF